MKVIDIHGEFFNPIKVEKGYKKVKEWTCNEFTIMYHYSRNNKICIKYLQKTKIIHSKTI